MKKVLAVVAGLALALTAAGCKKDEDCSQRDLDEHRSECGYYDNNSLWILYPWIIPGLGGHPPYGYHPNPPPGIQPRPPQPAPPKPAPPKPPAPAVKAPPPPPRPAPPPPRVGK